MPLPEPKLGRIIAHLCQRPMLHYIGRAGLVHAIPSLTLVRDSYTRTHADLCDAIGIDPEGDHGQQLLREGITELPRGARFEYAHIEPCGCTEDDNLLPALLEARDSRAA